MPASGKSTHARALATHLTAKGQTVVVINLESLKIDKNAMFAGASIIHSFIHFTLSTMQLY
jgi:adenylylsulfate kinase-like enzyme